MAQIYIQHAADCRAADAAYLRRVLGLGTLSDVDIISRMLDDVAASLTREFGTGGPQPRVAPANEDCLFVSSLWATSEELTTRDP